MTALFEWCILASEVQLDQLRPMQNPPIFSSNHIRLTVGIYTCSSPPEEQETCPLHFSICAAQTCSPLCPGQKPDQFAPFIPALKAKSYVRARGEDGAAFSQPCCAQLEKHISNNLALSSCKSRGPCQVPVFASPLYQAVASSFPGHPATLQREQEW